MMSIDFPHDQPILTISLSAIRDNYLQLKSRVGTSEVAAVVKADAYGLGASKIVPTLADAGCRTFFVAKFEEALALRTHDTDIIIYCLHGLPRGAESEAVESSIIPVINNLNELERWTRKARQTGMSLEAALHADTGMARLGLSADELVMASEDWPSAIKLNYLMSHLSVSENPEDPRNQQQYERFVAHKAYFPDAKASLGNSGACFLDNTFHFDLMRCGIGLYGGQASASPDCKMSPVVTLAAPVIQLQHIQRGTPVGYSGTWTAQRDSVIATIPVGYADGYARAGSNRFHVSVGEHSAQVIGNISMDLTTIDVTDLPESLIYPGAELQLMNQDITINDIADMSDAICYEVLTRLGHRFQRQYTEIATEQR